MRYRPCEKLVKRDAVAPDQQRALRFRRQPAAQLGGLGPLLGT